MDGSWALPTSPGEVLKKRLGKYTAVLERRKTSAPRILVSDIRLHKTKVPRPDNPWL